MKSKYAQSTRGVELRAIEGIDDVEERNAIEETNVDEVRNARARK